MYRSSKSYCTPETNIILYISYTSIKKIMRHYSKTVGSSQDVTEGQETEAATGRK